MNQRLLRTIPAGQRIAAGAPGRIDYDDGNPATVCSGRAPSVAPSAPATTDGVRPTALAEVPRIAATDYDDGDPATVIC